MMRSTLRLIASGSLLALLGGCATVQAPDPPGTIRADGPLVRYSFVAFQDERSLPWQPLEGFPGLQARLLAADPTLGRVAAVVRVPARHRAAGSETFAVSSEFYVLEGDLALGEQTLGAGDFAYVPPGIALPPLASARGARVLLFQDPATADAEALANQQRQGVYVTRGATAGWAPGTVSEAAGVAVPLEIKHLKQDPWTGARTWLVRIAGGAEVPWESHSVPEEGYLLDGDYRLAECLPDGTYVGDYRPGGYFFRPGGVLHSGPASGTRRGATWLMRAPLGLDVQFHAECRQGLGEGPLGTPDQPAP